MIVYLSYPLSQTTPAFGGELNRFCTKPIKSLSNGDSCNVTHLSFSSHLGTHIDTPFHFFQKGMTVTDYPASFWVFNKVKLVEVPLTSGRWISKHDMETELIDNIDLLLIKTNFCYKRQERMYWENNPGIDADLGRYLRKVYPNVRGVGFDFISVSRWQDREEGRLSHRAFLDPDGQGHPILLIEDMDLRPLSIDMEINYVSVFPLLIENADGAPVTVISNVS